MGKKRVLITGAAGLIGQNLVSRLKGRDDLELICIDKHAANCAIFRKLNPGVTLIEADLAQKGGWEVVVDNIDTLILNHAQIGALTEAPFIANNVTATANLLEVAKAAMVPYIVHISSSVVRSKADDFYTRSKTVQEKMVRDSGIPCVILRPTLMFGWFDRKHLGWLSRFMKRAPVFPIPNFGRYIRQPLYAGDFCNVIIACVDKQRAGQVYDISGQEKVFYSDLIKKLKNASGGKSIVVPIPYYLFWGLLWVYSKLFSDPPFTTTQLEALVIPEEFPVIDWPEIFTVQATPLDAAFVETYQHKEFSKITLEF